MSTEPSLSPSPPDAFITAPLQGPVTAAEVAKGIQWTVGKVFWTLGVFVFAGLAEIGGGWLVWQTVRNKKPWYYCLGGALRNEVGPRSSPARRSSSTVVLPLAWFDPESMGAHVGALVLAAYGFIPTLQPEGASFARVYAVYGGIFIIMSYGEASVGPLRMQGPGTTATHCHASWQRNGGRAHRPAVVTSTYHP